VEGDNLAPVIFLLAIQAAAESLPFSFYYPMALPQSRLVDLIKELHKQTRHAVNAV
jgi:hypothetical protein